VTTLEVIKDLIEEKAHKFEALLRAVMGFSRGEARALANGSCPELQERRLVPGQEGRSSGPWMHSLSRPNGGRDAA
jgi:hypothetical protein